MQLVRREIDASQVLKQKCWGRVRGYMMGKSH